MEFNEKNKSNNKFKQELSKKKNKTINSFL